MSILKSKLIFILMFIVLISNINFCITTDSQNEVQNEGIHSSAKIGDVQKSIGPKALSINFNNSVAITGDSYSGLFTQFKDKVDFKMNTYVFPGQTVVQNLNLMLEAAKSKYPILIISVGVNDHLKLTPPYIFEATVRDVIYKALENKKLIILHSFVDYPASKYVNTNYKISFYDGALKRIANDFDIVHYIDMSNYANNEFQSSDGIHYAKEFYDILYAKIVDLIDSIDF